MTNDDTSNEEIINQQLKNLDEESPYSRYIDTMATQMNTLLNLFMCIPEARLSPTVLSEITIEIATKFENNFNTILHLLKEEINHGNCN